MQNIMLNKMTSDMFNIRSHFVLIFLPPYTWIVLAHIFISLLIWFKSAILFFLDTHMFFYQAECNIRPLIIVLCHKKRQTSQLVYMIGSTLHLLSSRINPVQSCTSCPVLSCLVLYSPVLVNINRAKEAIKVLK